MSEPRPAFLPIFRSEHQAAIIGAIFSQPDRIWTGPELVATTGASQPTVSREVASLAGAGLVIKGSIGRTSTITANSDSPVFDELVQLAIKTHGPIGVLVRCLRALDGLQEAHIVGSWARRYASEHGRFPNDIDVALVGDVALIDALDACDAAAEEIGMPVQPTVVRSGASSRQPSPRRRSPAPPCSCCPPQRWRHERRPASGQALRAGYVVRLAGPVPDADIATSASSTPRAKARGPASASTVSAVRFIAAP